MAIIRPNIYRLVNHGDGHFDIVQFVCDDCGVWHWAVIACVQIPAADAAESE